MRCLFGFMLQSLNGMGSAQVVPSTLSKPCTHILTERPHCCAWLCRSCIWNGGLYTAFSYLDRSGPCAGFCGFFLKDALLRIYPFSMLPSVFLDVSCFYLSVDLYSTSLICHLSCVSSCFFISTHLPSFVRRQ